LAIAKIYIKDWLDSKPYKNPSNVDTYYLKLANSVKQKIEGYYILDFEEFDLMEHSNAFCCFLTGYFEDKISQLNIFNTFVKLHKDLYNKYLPFFEIGEDEYFEDDIYLEDIQFLIWYYFNLICKEFYLKPPSKYLKIIALEVYNIFEEEFETAQENKRLKEIFTFESLLQLTAGDEYYEFRDKLYVFYFQNYLFFPDIYAQIDEGQKEIFDYVESEMKDMEPEDRVDLIHIATETANDLNVEIVHNKHTKLLNIKSNEWFAAFLGKDHPLYHTIKKIKGRFKGDFLYKGHDESHIFLQHIATDNKINLARVSYEPIENFKEIDDIVTMGVVQWDGEWWFSGSASIGRFDADYILDCKNSSEKRIELANFMDAVDDDFNDLFINAFAKFNNGSAVAFLASNEIDDYIKSFIDYYNDLRSEEVEETLEKSIERAKSKGYFGGNEEKINLENSMDAAVLFCSRSRGIEIAPNVCSAFQVKENRFFNESDFEDSVNLLIHSSAVSKELTLYWFNNFSDKFTFLMNEENKYLTENLDFIMRFYKGENYHPKNTTATI